MTPRSHGSSGSAPLSGAGLIVCAGLLAAIGAGGCASSPGPSGLDRKAAAELAGEWGMQIQSQGHTVEAVLRFRFDGISLTGTLAEEGRDPRDLSNVQIAGGKISFDIDERSGTLHAQGVVEGEILSGKMKLRPEGGGGGPKFSLGGHGGRSGGRQGGAERSPESGSRNWTAYRRRSPEVVADSRPAAPPAAPAPGPAAAAPPAAAASGDARTHVRYGSISATDPLILTAEGERVAFTSSFSLSEGRYVPDPYVGQCSLVSVKYTLKTDDQISVLGKTYRAPDPESDDSLVLHPTELRNAAGRFGANAIYLRLNGTEELSALSPLNGCTLLDTVGGRARGESLNEVACRGEDGKVFKFSQYGGRASFYACPPAGGGRPARRRGR